MDRIIKFRAWDKVNNVMVQYHSIWEHHRPTHKATTGPGSGMHTFYNDIELMQYTGLHDKNDRAIFEGDILKCTSENFIGEVKSRPGEFVTDCRGWGEQSMSGVDLMDVEVIGNIHENPDLIK